MLNIVFTLVELLASTLPQPSCPPSWAMIEPGICERVTRFHEERTPHGGVTDVIDSYERRGSRLYCTGDSHLRQEGEKAWCQR